MKVAIVTPTTFPSCLPEDKTHFASYGSEHVGAGTIQAFMKYGPSDINFEFYAPIGSTNFPDNDRVNFHPIANTYGQHPQNSDDRLEKVCFEHGTKSEDLLKCDFVIDMSKFCCSIEDLYYYHKFRKFITLRSGHRDHNFPFRILTPADRHYVVHNKYFVDLYAQAGYPADYVNHGVSDFWCPGDNPEYWKYFEDKGLSKKGYFLYSHRASIEKGLGRFFELAKAFPNEKFVVSTSATLPDHIININHFIKMANDEHIDNFLYIPSPMHQEYHYYRREIIRNAKASLCVWLTDTGWYLDMLGYVGLEAIFCGCPLIASKAAGSLSMVGEEAHKKILLYIDSMESCKYAIEHFNSYDLKGHALPEWTQPETVNKYMELFKKYS